MTFPIPERVSLPSRPGSENDDVTVVSLRGELDIQDARALRACLGDIRWHGRPRSIIDLTRLTFIDCACLDVLVWHACEMRIQGGKVELAGPQGAVRRILSVTGLLTAFEVHDTVGQAAGGDHGCRSGSPPPANPQSLRSGADAAGAANHGKRNGMSILKKIRHKAQTAKGKTKKNTGRITGS